MFIGYYELEKEQYFNVYCKNKYGYKEWQKDTFCPDAKNIQVLDFKISGKTYKEKQASLEELAKNWQYDFASLSWSYGELCEIGNYFYKNGKRYGLLKEFRENAIC